MSILTDSSFVYALYNTKDRRHPEAMAFAENNDASLVIPVIIIPEVSYLFYRDLGYHGVLRFMKQFQQLNAQLQAVTRDDLARAHAIALTYASAEFDIVDCCIMAIAERLNLTDIATFDRRDFSIFRPKHVDYLNLLP